MIEKIVEISNLGHFVDYKFRGSNLWNGQFKKVNIIYAPNGSGKTTLATIFKSLAQNSIELMRFKKTFGAEDVSKVVIKEYDNSDLIKLGANSWNRNLSHIEVFDVNYIEDYLFAGSYGRKQNKRNLFRLLTGNEGLEYKKRIKFLLSRQNNLKKKLRTNKDSASIIEELSSCKKEFENEVEKFDLFTKRTYDIHVNTVNKYLAKFVSYIKLKKFDCQKDVSDYEQFRIFPVFEVYDEEVVFSPPEPGKWKGNARYSMSEGDKSTIALCFFLARLEIQEVSDKIIVFDDPLSSFDYSRRNATIFHLSKIALNSVQFFLLTHDLSFANDFSDKCSFLDCVTLKIDNDGLTSYLKQHDFKSEFLTSSQKDLLTITRYIADGAKDESEKREVIRCIRPVLEGVLKTKFFIQIKNDTWLGSIIELISNSTPESKLYRLKEIKEELIELNDYTKSFHHDSGDSRNIPIDSKELKRYVELLIGVIDRI